MTNLPQGWEKFNFDNIFYSPSSKNYQLNTKDYLEKGCIPIIDQSKKFIIGYSNDYEKVFKINNCNNSCIIFGDHTRVLKFIDFDFIVGADGVKILLNKDIERFNTKFLFFQLLYKDIPLLGYRRHFSVLKQSTFSIPPLKEQERIVGILDESFAKIDESIKILEQDLLNLDELMQSALQKAFNPLKDNAKENYKLPQSWEWKSLEEISENISAGGDKPKNCTESKTAKNQIPVYANGVNNNGLVGYTDKATIIKPSLTISARGTIGFVCIRKEPYFPIVRLISLIPCENILCLHYLYFCLNFFIAKGEGSSIPQLTIPKFKSLQIPLPPLKEQEQIAKHLDFVFEKTKALKELYTKELKDYEELKQSLLNKAFKGEL
ncbi:TPA: restriction endonuclease subunit S [Campylobacter coli]|nr:restriction endonuclease subunit S [Campylobacter coli]HEG0328189.1 restriction endonuclease subunit S [Campylobacter coli]HEG0329664.1 restriction endonuclease subunit S [Campylobacter coli]HEG0358707.1 restriction endonuclease subunit S [Campylobacter coli]